MNTETKGITTTGSAAVVRFAPESLADKEAEELAKDWLDAKEAEDRCKAWRIAVEDALSKLAPYKTEGSKATRFGAFTVTLTGTVYRKLDVDKWESIKARVPSDFQLVVRDVPTLDETGFKWLRDNAPDVFAVVAGAVTERPGKIGVKVVHKLEADVARKAA